MKFMKFFKDSPEKILAKIKKDHEHRIDVIKKTKCLYDSKINNIQRIVNDITSNLNLYTKCKDISLERNNQTLANEYDKLIIENENDKERYKNKIMDYEQRVNEFKNSLKLIEDISNSKIKDMEDLLFSTVEFRKIETDLSKNTKFTNFKKELEALNDRLIAEMNVNNDLAGLTK